MTPEEEKVVLLERLEREGAAEVPYELYKEVRAILRRTTDGYAQKPHLWKNHGMPIIDGFCGRPSK